MVARATSHAERSPMVPRSHHWQAPSRRILQRHYQYPPQSARTRYLAWHRRLTITCMRTPPLYAHASSFTQTRSLIRVTFVTQKSFVPRRRLRPRRNARLPCTTARRLWPFSLCSRSAETRGLQSSSATLSIAVSSVAVLVARNQIYADFISTAIGPTLSLPSTP
eukprot:4872791-Pleurochrysis_carterae.AAC.1